MFRGVITLITLALLPISGALAETEDKPRFDVLEYRVLGNTVLAARDVEAAVYQHLGPGKTLDDVELARQALENAYRVAGRGTVFVDIPAQDVSADGVVRLKVTEGKLRTVRVTGSRYFSGRRIRESLPAAEDSNAPDLPALQGQITALNTETADRSVTPVLAAGSLPGTVNLTLKVDDKLPLHASVEANDQYTADTSRTRLNLSLSYDNLFGRLDSFGLQYQTAPQERGELGVLVASYTRNLGEGRRFALFFVDSDSDVPALGTLNVLGKGKVYGSRWIIPFGASDDASHVLTVGADYKDFLESINLDKDTRFNTPISYLHFSLADSSTWRYGAHSLSLSPSLNFGARGVYNSVGEFADKRFHGRPNYFYLRAAGQYRSAPWHGFSFVTNVSGQYAPDALIGNEQFTIGGADGVRGYLEAEEINDIGIKGNVQLESPAWKTGLGDATLGGFLFYDAGVVSAVGPLLPDEVRRADLSSAGIGLAFVSPTRFDGFLTWAYPLVPGPRTAVGDSRLLFSVRAHW